MRTLDIIVDGTPRTKGSWRPIIRGGKIRLLPQTDEKPWHMAVAWSAKAARPILIKKPKGCVVALTFSFATPKKASNSFPTGDVDKLARSILDALTGICWVDDVQVVDLRVTKQFASTPSVGIVVTAPNGVA